MVCWKFSVKYYKLIYFKEYTFVGLKKWEFLYMVFSNMKIFIFLVKFFEIYNDFKSLLMIIKIMI